MTQNQIAYWNYKEAQKHNRATEKETSKHNRITEAETGRHNQVSEYVDLGNLDESQRTHKANEAIQQQNVSQQGWKNQQDVAINQGKLAEEQRSNAAQEKLKLIDINVGKQQKDRELDIKQQEADTHQQELDIKKAAQETDRAYKQAISSATKVAAALKGSADQGTINYYNEQIKQKQKDYELAVDNYKLAVEKLDFDKAKTYLSAASKAVSDMLKLITTIPNAKG